MGAGFQIGIITTQPLNIGASVPNLSISAPCAAAQATANNL